MSTSSGVSVRHLARTSYSPSPVESVAGDVSDSVKVL